MYVLTKMMTSNHLLSLLFYAVNKQEDQLLLPVESMSLTVSQGEGLTVITVSSNPKSKWPVLCQILRLLCCSPVCSVSQNMKGMLTNIHTALGVSQTLDFQALSFWIDLYLSFTDIGIN